MENKSVVVSTERLNSNLILAEDVLMPDGFVLATKDTMLNAHLIASFKAGGISNVRVKAVDYGASAGGDISSYVLERQQPVQSRKEFIEFEKVAEKKEAEVREKILEIGNGGKIDLEALYNITEGVMSGLELKADIFTYLNFLKMKDDHTFSHSLNVSLLCNLFGRWMGLSYDRLVALTVSGLLHDIGKTRIDMKILKKPQKLTVKEFEIIKKHTTYGYEILSSQRISKEIKEAALMHHEKNDGTGYPQGLRGDQISSYAKVVAVCDIYDAMTADRVYRNKLCPFDVIRKFEQNSYGELDTNYLLMFLKNIAYTYTSAQVSLSDGREGEVVFINAQDLSRPIVMAKSGEFIDLSQQRDINISTIL